MTQRALILLLLGAATLMLFARVWVSVRHRPAGAPMEAGDELRAPTLTHLLIGLVTNFFDTLGIGSFATTTAVFRLWKLVPDERIPGTLIVGHAVPVAVQVVIFLGLVNVDPTLLVLLISACVLGGWLGAGLVARLARRKIQVAMGTALLAAAVFMVMSNLGLFPGAGTALTLSGPKLFVALACNFLFGALLTIGIGHYGPSLVLFSLLGMEPRAAFPIMMGSGGFVAMLAGFRFVGFNRVHLQAALGLTLGGVPGVLVAGLIVKSLPLTVLRWMVVTVVVYAAWTLIRAAVERPRSPEPVAGAA